MAFLWTLANVQEKKTFPHQKQFHIYSNSKEFCPKTSEPITKMLCNNGKVGIEKTLLL